MESSSSTLSSSSSKQQRFERFQAAHMKAPSLSAENSQQLHSQSDRLTDLVLVRKSCKTNNGNSNTTSTSGAHIIFSNHFIPNIGTDGAGIAEETHQRKKQLSVRGTSSKLYNKRFLNFLPRQISQQQQVNSKSTASHSNSRFVTSDKFGGATKIKEENYQWDNNCLSPFDFYPLFYKGFPEVRKARTEISSNGFSNSIGGSGSQRGFQFYRIPKLLEQAFQPEVYRSYSYKCAVRNSQNVLSPQTVGISLPKNCKPGFGRCTEVDNKAASEGHFALAPIQPSMPTQHQRQFHHQSTFCHHQ